MQVLAAQAEALAAQAEAQAKADEAIAEVQSTIEELERAKVAAAKAEAYATQLAKVAAYRAMVAEKLADTARTVGIEYAEMAMEARARADMTAYNAKSALLDAKIAAATVKRLSERLLEVERLAEEFADVAQFGIW